KMDEIIAAQGPSPISSGLGDLVHEVRAHRDGVVSSVDCLRIATLARLAGAPTDPGAGLDLLAKMGTRVRAGQPLYKLYASEPSDFGFAVEAADRDSGVSLAA
ncbi:MAG TPA: thymidine phosphorylase, partial [Phenylobacterium sp.]|nr:thymidine phosphorylase [Phenylobacterium sp.]